MVRVIDPVTARVPISMSPLSTSLVTERLPPTVTNPLSVMPLVSAALPVLMVKSPSIVDAAMISFVVPPSIVASASAPESSLVVSVSAPVNALVVVSKTIVALFALVVSVEVPFIVSAAFWVMLPVVAVAVRLPSTVDAAKFRPTPPEQILQLFTIVA